MSEKDKYRQRKETIRLLQDQRSDIENGKLIKNDT